MKLIVGLGNPGREYTQHRHNVGWMALEAIASKLFPENEWSEKKDSFIIKGERVVLLRPTTFMNSSGSAVMVIAKFNNIEPKDIIVVHDEMDIPFGEVRNK